jgi:hypothetical protein
VQRKILHRQPLGVARTGEPKNGAGALGKAPGIVRPGEHGKPQRAREPHLEDRADIGAGAAERGQVGDQRLAGADVRLVAPGDAVRLGQSRPIRRLVGQFIQRRNPGEAVPGADFLQRRGAGDGVGQKHIGSGEIDAHVAPPCLSPGAH